jgi:hypothetical protein
MTKNCFIQWDNQSYKLNNNSSEFSIQNLPGLPFKITWDNSEHIINNPSNFSYQITENIILVAEWLFSLNSFPYVTRCESSRNTIDANIIDNTLWTASGIQNNTSTQTVPENYRMTFTSPSRNIEAGVTFKVDLFHKSWCNWGRVRIPATAGASDFGSGQLRYIQKIIRITDNNIVYEYPITNTNSVQVINSIGENKIIIEGQEFDILDVDSAKKYCDDNCPNGTIECGCGGRKCCYEKVFYGYKLVKVI